MGTENRPLFPPSPVPIDCEYCKDKGDEYYEKAKARLKELGVA